MKRLLIFGLPALAVIAVLLFWYTDTGAEKQSQQISALEKVGDECDLIAEKAAMNLPEALPFQKLEKAGRRARVLEDCMHDRAYIENPAWAKFAQPQAQKIAQTQHLSYSEAYENLRRKGMLKFKTAKDEPVYWVMPQK
ncbi:MAG: hypothetical protein ABL880_05905 [Methylotenera sp.]